MTKQQKQKTAECFFKCVRLKPIQACFSISPEDKQKYPIFDDGHTLGSTRLHDHNQRCTQSALEKNLQLPVAR